jgi:predicted regulator of Ras-like GTPase activity (Roadblock/LC7/MglB family)
VTARLDAVIESTLQAPGVVAAVLADSSGFAIEGASWTEGDLATAARSAIEMLKLWASVGTELGIGDVRALLIERGGGPVAVCPAPQGGALVVVGNQSCRPGRLRRDAGLARDALVEVARTPAEPLRQLNEPAGEADEAGPPSGRFRAGEIVLVGAHTFRLVTKLVARLLQTKGVRSSRLRAYSPASTIIDVSLEEGATLAAIGQSCFSDFPIKTVAWAEGRNRLVLNAAEAPLRTPTPIGSPR